MVNQRRFLHLLLPGVPVTAMQSESISRDHSKVAARMAQHSNTLFVVMSYDRAAHSAHGLGQFAVERLANRAASFACGREVWRVRCDNTPVSTRLAWTASRR